MNEKSIFKDCASKNLMHMRNKKGISLIVLVISIIILAILVAVTIITLTNTQIIKSAQDSVDINNKEQAKEEYRLIMMDYMVIESQMYIGDTELEAFLTNYSQVTSAEKITSGENEGKYLIKIEGFEFVFPYGDIVDSDIPKEPTISQDNSTAAFDIPIGEYDTSAEYYEAMWLRKREVQYPVEIHILLAGDETYEEVRFYKKEVGQTDDMYVPALVREYDSSISDEPAEPVYFIETKGYDENTSRLSILFVDLDPSIEYILKVEYTLSDGSIIYAVSENETPSVCFVAGTQVLTENGLCNIENITKGMKVYSRNISTGENELKSVLATCKNTVKTPIYEIDLGLDTIKSTGNHPYYVRGRGFVEAKDLCVGDVLVSLDNIEIIIKGIKITLSEDAINVYNLKVEDNSNYFVGETNVLVHNANCPS